MRIENPDVAFIIEGFETPSLLMDWAKKNIGESLAWLWTSILENFQHKPLLTCVFGVYGHLKQGEVGSLNIVFDISHSADGSPLFSLTTGDHAYFYLSDAEVVAVIRFHFAQMMQMYMSIPNLEKPIEQILAESNIAQLILMNGQRHD
jgi:hypothetical protein